MNKKILIVDDEIKLLEILKEFLINDGYDVYSSYNGKEALKLFKIVKPDFVVLDLMLPDISGEEICKTIREDSDVPILMLTAKVEEEDKLNGLSIGADDYMTKPFSPRELLLRIKVILRRTEKSYVSKDILNFSDGDIKIYKEEYKVEKAGKEINITPNEFKILLVLAENSNRTFSRSQLITAALGYDFVGYDRTIDTHVKNIRQKIEDDIKNPKFIHTVYGIGYKFIGE